MASRPTSPRLQFAQFLSRFPAEIQALVKRSLPHLRRHFPSAHELVYEYPDSLVVSWSLTGAGRDGVVALAIFAHGVRLYFRKDLPDPKALLEGSGSKVRSVSLSSAAQLQRGEIYALLQSAVRQAGGPWPQGPAPRLVIQSAKQPSARAKRAKREAAEQPKQAATKRRSAKAVRAGRSLASAGPVRRKISSTKGRSKR